MKKTRRFLFVPLTACLSTIAISYAQVASGAQTSTQSGPTSESKVYVCQVGKNNKLQTKLMSKKTVLGLIEDKSDEWVLGKCEDVISPS